MTHRLMEQNIPEAYTNKHVVMIFHRYKEDTIKEN